MSEETVGDEGSRFVESLDVRADPGEAARRHEGDGQADNSEGNTGEIVRPGDDAPARRGGTR
jgi:hypothetical protein